MSDTAPITVADVARAVRAAPQEQWYTDAQLRRMRGDTSGAALCRYDLDGHACAAGHAILALAEPAYRALSAHPGDNTQSVHALAEAYRLPGHVGPLAAFFNRLTPEATATLRRLQLAHDAFVHAWASRSGMRDAVFEVRNLPAPAADAFGHDLGRALRDYVLGVLDDLAPEGEYLEALDRVERELAAPGPA